MTERQRLISKYTQHLSRAIDVKYRLHFLLHEKDSASRTMLSGQLEDVIGETGNESVRKAYNNAKQGCAAIAFGQHNKNKSNKLTKDIQESRFGMGNDKKDHKLAGSNQLHSLYLEDALRSFSKHIIEIREKTGHVNYNDKMYRERTEINLILGNYPEALSLAQKGNLSDMAFIAAITNGNFDVAKQYVKQNCRSIVNGDQDRNVIVSTFEKIYLIMFVLFATSSSSEAKSISDEIFGPSGFDLKDLRKWTDNFCQRNFTNFLADLSEMKKIFELSIYTYPVVEQLANAIIQNTVLLYLYPLARAISFIQNGIRNQKLYGKLDLVANTYNGDININNDHNQMKEYFNQVSTIRKNFEINLWIREYNATNRKKVSK